MSAGASLVLDHAALDGVDVGELLALCSTWHWVSRWRPCFWSLGSWQTHPLSAQALLQRDSVVAACTGTCVCGEKHPEGSEGDTANCEQRFHVGGVGESGI